jgi:hypothetical protein
VKKVLPTFEHRAQPVIPPHQFFIRLAHSGIIAVVLIAGSLAVGIYCGLAVIVVAGVILAPVAHRILHTFHIESRDR